MLGKAEYKVREDMARASDIKPSNIEALAPQKSFPGNRPSTTLTVEALSPFGA